MGTRLDTMNREEMLAHISDEDLEKLLSVKANELSKLTDNLTTPLDVLDPYDDGLYDDYEFTKICEDRAHYSQLTEVEKESVRRWAEIEALRDHYTLFEDFLFDCMTELMGFKCSELQVDMGKYMQYGPRRSMIQAQRSQAKSTIVAMFAVWQLIHDCKHRVLIISAGSEVASEIANWVIQIIMNWDILASMRPDRQHGDRASTKAFDVHWQLKGPEKSPSIACIGITANMQGRRADLLVPDDIESSKNGTTETQRAILEHLSKDFTSICKSGRIMYLGTPQTVDSVYNILPQRGYEIRVWTGRVPTDEEARHYGDNLAPFIQAMMDDPANKIGGGLDGSRGVPTDPLLLGEQTLNDKELDQGPAYFNLQHMLNTELSDELRHPLKCKNLVVMNFSLDEAPGRIDWLPSPDKLVPAPGYICKPQLYRPFNTSQELYKFEGKHVYVDTAGGGKNGDETVAVVTNFLHGYIFVPEILKLPGGYNDDYYVALSQLCMRHNVNSVDVEKNFGFGAFAAAWRPVMLREYKKEGKDNCPRIEDVWESGQKELRIIDTLEPIMARHRLIIHEDVIAYDTESAKKYPIDSAESYKLFHQISKISRAPGSLLHDDSIDSLAGGCRKWVERTAIDENIRMAQKVTDENVQFFEEWGASIGKNQNGTLGLSSDRFNRPHTRRGKSASNHQNRRKSRR